jgi:hypothetical protein
MADIDFITDLSSGYFVITLGDNPTSVVGNRALVNRFQITFLTTSRSFVLGNQYVTDSYGGNAQKFVNQPQVLNNLQSVSAAVATAIELTVKSMMDDQSASMPDTERIASANLESLDIVGGLVSAVINIVPVETESYDVLKLNLPITRV